MRIIALFHNELGEARATIATLLDSDGIETDADITSPEQNIPAQIAAELDEHNPHAALFFITLPETGERPDIADTKGNEVPVQFIEVTLI